jgi:hypothetical protein
MCAREMIENAIGLKQAGSRSGETVWLTELLVAKDTELRQCLRLASHQATINHTMDMLRAEVDKLDQDIQLLQRQLKEAEQILVSTKS